MNNSHVLSGSIVVILAAIIGASVSLRSWNGISYYYLDENKRHPAAVRRAFDFSQLEGDALELASQKRLLSDARVVNLKKGFGWGIELGHFITRGDRGERQFACGFYDRVELTFFAKGMAISGERPLMMVEAGCRIGDNVNRISAIPIPVSKILQEPPGDLEFQYLEENPVVIKFNHVVDQWPRKWSLYSVRLFHHSITNREVKVDSTQIQNISTNDEVQMTW